MAARPGRRKYTKEILEPVVKRCYSISGVLRELGIKQGGGSQSYIKKLIDFYGVDSSHFLGQGWNTDLKFKPCKPRPPEEVLTKKDPAVVLNRQKGETLKRCLKEIGRDYSCEECGLIDTWNKKPLVLQVDHINGDAWDDRKENLRFLCPNCHSQTETYCGSSKKRQ